MLSKQPQESWWKMMLACTGVLVVEKERSVCVYVGGGRAWFIHRGKKAEFDDLTVSNEMASGAALRAQSMQENVQIWEENLECIAVSQLSGYAAWGFGPNTLLQGCIN